MTSPKDPNERATESEFERRLLDSAGADELPDADLAFQRFAHALGAATLAASNAPASALPSAPVARLKWLALSALGGGALSAALLALLFRGTPAVEANHSAASAGTAPVVVASTLAPTLTPTLTPKLTPPFVSASPEKAAHAELAARREPASPRARQRPPAAPSAAPATPSSLLAEVAALDSVRAKLALGDASGALALIERYRSEFPSGQLARDADALGIQALAALGERGEVARRAAAFLGRSPDDPHAARVRQLAGEGESDP